MKIYGGTMHLTSFQCNFKALNLEHFWIMNIKNHEKSPKIACHILQTTISVGLNTSLSNIVWTWTLFFENRTNLSMYIYWWSNFNTWILGSNKRTSNIKHKRPLLNSLNYSLYRIEHHKFEHRLDLNVFIFW